MLFKGVVMLAAKEDCVAYRLGAILMQQEFEERTFSMEFIQRYYDRISEVVSLQEVESEILNSSRICMGAQSWTLLGGCSLMTQGSPQMSLCIQLPARQQPIVKRRKCLSSWKTPSLDGGRRSFPTNWRRCVVRVCCENN